MGRGSGEEREGRPPTKTKKNRTKKKTTASHKKMRSLLPNQKLDYDIHIAETAPSQNKNTNRPIKVLQKSHAIYDKILFFVTVLYSTIILISAKGHFFLPGDVYGYNVQYISKNRHRRHQRDPKTSNIRTEGLGSLLLAEKD